MSEPREVVVASLLQAHQLAQRLDAMPGVEAKWELDGWPKRRFTITATVEQWAEIDQHLKTIRGEPAKTPATCQHTVTEYDERGRGTCRLCGAPR